MDVGSPSIQDLIDRPGESLSVEVKRWISPEDPEGAAKIVRATIALRNNGGGYLVIGFDNETMQPDTPNVPPDVKGTFHIDKVQGLVSKYASEAFEVKVEFGYRNGHTYPVIVVPSGVRTPVAAKADLFLAGTKLVAADDVYVRSLNANNTPSSTKARWKDWAKTVEVCFETREADIGRFLRRHLVGVTPDAVKTLADALHANTAPAQSTEQLLREQLDKGEERFGAVLTGKQLTVPAHGTWQVALLLIGDVPPHSADRQFLNLLDSSNPGYTGWPIWLDSRGFSDQSARPYVFDGAWETLVVSLNTGWIDHVDFMRLNPQGRFYLLRALQDDISGAERSPQPLTELDFGLPITRTAEAIAVGVAFAKAMGCVPESCALAFAFRWTGLRGRLLTSWAQPGRDISPGRRAYQDDITVFVDVPLDVPLSALSEFVNQVVQPLYGLFDGFALGKKVVDDLTTRVIERRL